MFSDVRILLFVDNYDPFVSIDRQVAHLGMEKA